MSAHDYYNPGRPGYSDSYPGFDTPQPHDSPQPYAYSSHNNKSYTDTSYDPSPHRATPQRYPSGYSEQDVPLGPYKSRHSQASIAPLNPHYDDPFVRDAKPGHNKPLPLPEEERGWRGWFKGRITWCCFIFSIIQIAVFIAELGKMGSLTGSPIQTKPSINPMIGPSSYVLINMGARYQPCMHWVEEVTNVNQTLWWPCPSTVTANVNDNKCTLAELCGFNGVNVPENYGDRNQQSPNQWFRFIVPIFLHAGIVHIGFNLLLQLTLGRDMEKAIGTLRFLLVYVCSGIFGFVLGGNFAAEGIASTGASGSLFGILALNLLDLLYFWKMRISPGKELAFIVLDIVIAFVLGLLPGLDNFSHIGGFLMGLVLGLCLLHSPPALSRRLGEEEVIYEPAYNDRPPKTTSSGMRGFVKGPFAFFQGRKPLWWLWWLVRVAALIGTIVGFILLIKNFYVWRTTCSWCKYLSCINVNNWCDIGKLQISPNTKRDATTMAQSIFRAGHDL